MAVPKTKNKHTPQDKQNPDRSPYEVRYNLQNRLRRRKEREKREKKKIPKGRSAQYKALQDEMILRQMNERKTTYAADYCPKELQMRRPFTSAGEQSYKQPVNAFSGQSMYQVSYKHYSPEAIKNCRPNMIPPQPQLHSNHHTLVNSLQLEIEGDNPGNNNGESNPGNPIAKVTEQEPKLNLNDVHKLQENVSVQVPETPLEVEPGLITTFMADYRPNWNVKKRTLCKPDETNYRKLVTPFDGTTTQSAEYKAWPVSKPEVPTWAKKPEYKPPIEGMALNSTYSMDFADPKVIQKVAAMKRPVKNEDIIKPGYDNFTFDQTTTYNTNFKEWKGAQPAKTYLVKSVYNPPVEKMQCESTHRSYYRGQSTPRADLIRHVSEHRQLNKDGKLNFRTTYKETYKDHRPKSCPGAIRGTTVLVGIKKAWEDNLTPQKQLNTSHDSGIDMIECDNQEEYYGDKK